MATVKKPIYQTVGDQYAGGNRNAADIGTYKNTGVNGYQNAGVGGMSQTAMDAQKRNADLYAAQQASKIPLSFGDKVATPNVGGTGPTPEEFARMNAGASTVGEQYANGVRDEKVIGSYNPNTILTNEDAAKAIAGIVPNIPNTANVDPSTPEGYYANKTADGQVYYTTNNNGVMSNPGQPSGSSATSDMDRRIAELQDAISARYDDMMWQAKEVSRMNQSSITGNLGRVFGANADTSEAAPVLTENGRLNTNLQSLATARNQALSELSFTALNKAQEQQRYEQQARSQEQQQAFNNLIAQAGLTGSYNGQQTLEGRQQGMNEEQQKFMRAIQEAGLTGQYNGSQTLDAQQIAFQKALQEAGLTGMYNGGLTQDAISNMAGLTGYFNGQPTLQRETANLTNQQKTLNDYLDYIASTTNNQNTNQTKLTNTGLVNSGKIDLANINNQADLEQLLKTLLSKETVAGMNNTSKESIASQNNQTKLDLLTQRLASGQGSASDTKLADAIATIQAKKDAAIKGSYISDGLGGVVQSYKPDTSIYDSQIANLLAQGEKKN